MTPAEHHLGDRLAALVDGELGHDARERVLSHLATCWSCKAEADAQRRLKNVFADTAPPPPSDGLLARLQGLPAGGDAMRPGPGGPLGPGGPGGPGAFADDDDIDRDAPRGPGAEVSPDADERTGLPTVRTGGRSPWAFDHLPVGRTGARSPLTPHRGFRIHEVHRVDRAERAASRGRRFAFAAAGAFSLAALAIGGALTSGAAGGSPVASGDGSGTSAGPVRSASSGSGATARDSRDNRDNRRRAGGEHRLRAGVLSASAAASLSASTFAAGSGGSGSKAGDRTAAGPPAPSSQTPLFSLAGSSGSLLRSGAPGPGATSPATGASGWPSQISSAPSLSAYSAFSSLTPRLQRPVPAPRPETASGASGAGSGTTADAVPLGAIPGRTPMATAPAAPAVTAAPPGR
ncbi:anti-sigma factor family protein [Streptomyces sp. NPDC048172]|uniref:anti-sigma factor family protein n=1 Tax=Streptomyces sp. NPDC048172 TaxID=3365505 RepID=UPI00371BE997